MQDNNQQYPSAQGIIDENRCRVTGVPLTLNNTSICAFIEDGAAESLLPVLPGLLNARQRRFLERELESVLYGLYQEGKLPPYLQRLYEEDNRELEEQERLDQHGESGWQ